MKHLYISPDLKYKKTQKKGQYGALEPSPTYMCGNAQSDAEVVKY